MVAEAKDQIAASSQGAFFMVSSKMEPVASGNGYAPKVRKPYTIKKQRERWTEDEHRKFVEALKLYGRAWCHIEEHVGTKTVIQIRSHAQKFFAKVTRDSNIDGAGCLNPIEIPPPRPKKKPLHPYPRKLVDSANTQVVIVSHSPDETANRSPTSVLSVIDYNEIRKSCLSPTSCATDAHPAWSLFMKRGDDEYVKSEIPAKDNIGSRSSMRTYFPSAPDNKSNMKLELFHQEDSSYTSIKLFGKTVVVRDTQKQSLGVSENVQLLSPDFVRVKLENNTDEFVQGLRSTNVYSQVTGNGSKSTASCFLPQFRIVKLQREEHDAAKRLSDFDVFAV